VAKRDDGVRVVCIQVFKKHGVLLVYYTIVIPNERGHGVGAYLFDFVLRTARHAGLDVCGIVAAEHMKFYEKLGARPMAADDKSAHELLKMKGMDRKDMTWMIIKS
jgi:GNAT superfamily N-acetyltransferase